MSTVVLERGRNPFPGLRPFQEHEEHLFFGRESQVHTMVDNLSRTRFLAVLGASGSGKSSLVNCGLRPALHRGLMAKAGTSWRMAQFRPGSYPLSNMARALAKDDVLFGGFDSTTLSLQDIIEGSLRMCKLGLSRIYEDAHLPAGSNLLVVVDQFEELFRYRGLESSDPEGQRNQEITAFVNLLLDPRNHPDLPIYIVLAMRSDFLGDCAEFAGLPEAINEGQYLVPRLTREERRAAIAGPVGVGGARISPVLLTRLVNDVGDNPDQLSILQHALNRTWARWESQGPDGPLDLQQYEEIGTMAHALDRHAEKAYGELGNERHRRICEKIFKALTDRGTDPRGIRRPTKFSLLCQLAEADEESVARVIDVFRKPSRSFLMPPQPESLEADRVIDISHESLMRIWERLKVWTEEEVQSAGLYCRLSETAALHAAGKAGLWDDPDLQFALAWQEREKPTAAWAALYGGGFDRAMDFLAESQAHRDNELRQQEEARQRELRQAQELAAERERRLEEQAQAAHRLKLRLMALRVVAALLLVAGMAASLAAFKAKRATEDAENAKKREETARKTAQSEAWDLDQSFRSLKRKDQQLEESNESLRAWSRLTREERLRSASTVADLARELIQGRTPQQSVPWLKQRGHALMELHSFQEAQSVLDRSLSLAPDDEEARTSRGYLGLLNNDPQKALADFKYIRDQINPKSTINYLNLSIAQAELAQHFPAVTSSELALKNLVPAEFDGAEEEEVSPHILQATGRTKLVTDADAFGLALLYMRANLDAYVGAPTFANKLQAADEHAEQLSRAAQLDGYLTALNWAWLQLRVRPTDYGAWASQGYLWQKAGYPEWSWCYYEKFQQLHKRAADPRYRDLARWVEQNKSKPADLPASFSCSGLTDRKMDLATLELEARENQARQQFRDAVNGFDLVLKEDPKNVRVLLEQAGVLFELGLSDRKNADSESNQVAFAKDQLNDLRKQKIDDETSLQHLGTAEAKETVESREALEEKYSKLISSTTARINAHNAEWQRLDFLAKQDFRKLRDDCNRILAAAPSDPRAYFYRALANYFLNSGSPPEKAIEDLKLALKGDPTSLDTLDWLSYLTSNSNPEEALSYVVRYQSLFPGDPAMYTRRAQIEVALKRYGEALHSIETAIAMDATNLANYDIQAQAQRGMGFSESRIQRTLAFGYRRASDLLDKQGESAAAQKAYNQSWKKLAEIAGQGSSEEIRCDSDMITCTFTKTERVTSEWIFADIESIDPRTGSTKIDKGQDDGVVVGEEGAIWSPYSRSSDGSERQVTKLGTAKVLSIEGHSALVRITLDSPEKGSDSVRVHDCVRLKARTRPHPQGSRLWSLATYNISIEDLNHKTILDYRTLYSNDTPELDDFLLRAMLDDLHRSAGVFGDRIDVQFFHGKPIPKGVFEGKTVREAMENATLDDLNKSLDSALHAPGAFFGNRWNTGTIYAAWIVDGSP
jgi:hypothetical protein